MSRSFVVSVSPRRVCRGALLAIVLLGATALPAGTVEELLHRGSLEEAERLMERSSKEAAGDALASGRLALYGNRLDLAERYLTSALESATSDGDPSRADAARALAEVHSRRGEFGAAASLLEEVHPAAASQLRSFGGRTPYALSEASPRSSRIPFVQTDPLPLLEARIDGGDPVYLLLDTGAGQLILDSEFAAERGLATFGSGSGTVAGGQQAEYELGAIRSLGLGEWTLEDLPVKILPTRRLAPVAGGRTVDGILGTHVLSRFRATIDYPGGVLLLQRLGEGESPNIPDCAFEMPFWMAGDHFLLARGTVGDLEPGLFLVDTGLAGPAFAAPRSTLEALGVELEETPAMEGLGGAGKVSVKPFDLDRLSLGAVERQGLVGLAGAFPESLPQSLGLPVVGLISHAFFRPYALSFDFGSMRLRMTPEGCRAPVSESGAEG